MARRLIRRKLDRPLAFYRKRLRQRGAMELARRLESRQCGACQLCCYVKSISSIEKPGYHRCDHLGGHGCQIYKSRPAECRTYYCAWRLGFGRLEHRPDRIRSLLELSESADSSRAPLWSLRVCKGFDFDGTLGVIEDALSAPVPVTHVMVIGPEVPEDALVPAFDRRAQWFPVLECYREELCT